MAEAKDKGWYDKIHAYDVDDKLRCNFIKSIFPKETLDRTRNFNLTKDDVVIVSYPKTGTHWAAEMAYLIQNDCNVSLASDKILLDRVFFIEFRRPDGTITLDHLEAMKTPRIMFSHLHAQFFKKTLDKPKDQQCKFILPFRNPKDTLISFHHFFKLNSAIDIDVDFNTFFEFFREGKLPFGDPFDWLLTWWDYRDNENILFLAFEDMKKDHPEAVRQIAKFLGKKLTEEQVATVVDATSFKSMKKNESVNWDKKHPLKIEGSESFMRAGTVGGWKELFTQDQVDYVNKMIAEKYRPRNIPCEDHL